MISIVAVFVMVMLTLYILNNVLTLFEMLAAYILKKREIRKLHLRSEAFARKSQTYVRIEDKARALAISYALKHEAEEWMQ